MFVDTLTDNTTRTVADVRSVFNKFGGNLGTTGSLAFLFDHKCVFTFKKKDGMDMEEFILEMIDFDVEEDYDEDEEEGTITIYGAPTSYSAIQKHLEEGGFEDVGGEFPSRSVNSAFSSLSFSSLAWRVFIAPSKDAALDSI